METPKSFTLLIKCYETNVHPSGYAKKNSRLKPAIIFLGISVVIPYAIFIYHDKSWPSGIILNFIMITSLLNLIYCFILIRIAYKHLKKVLINEVKTEKSINLDGKQHWVNYYDKYLRKDRLLKLIGDITKEKIYWIRETINHDIQIKEQRSLIILVFKSPVHTIFISIFIGIFFVWLETFDKAEIRAYLEFFFEMAIFLYPVCFGIDYFLKFYFLIGRNSMLIELDEDLKQLEYEFHFQESIDTKVTTKELQLI